MLEIIATCVDDAIAIEKHGGERIELVSALTEGGLTPSYGLIKRTQEQVSLPINVMIKPHAKSSVYTEQDLQTMLEDIQVAKDLGVAGVVLGLIDPEGEIDEKNLTRLLAHTGNMQVTFRRAIDETRCPVTSVRTLIKYPEITRILTSGGPGRITDNLNVIREMVEAARGKIDIMPGSGMTQATLRHIMEATGTTEVHFGTAVRVNNSAYENICPRKMQDLAKEYREIKKAAAKRENKNS